MKVICLRSSLTNEERELAGASMHIGFTYDVSEGKIYSVLGVTFLQNSPAFGGMVLFQVIDDTGRLIPVPGVLFEIAAPEIPSNWIANFRPDGAFALWPRAFFEEWFHERLLDRDPDAVRKLEEVIKLDLSCGT